MNINEEIKATILNNVSESQEVNEIKTLAKRYGSVCDENILIGLRNTLLVKSKRDEATGRLTGNVKVDSSRLRDFYFSVLSQNVRGQSIRNESFRFVKQLLNLRQDIEIEFITGRDRAGVPFVSVKDMVFRNFRDRISILEKMIINSVKGVLDGKQDYSKVR